MSGHATSRRFAGPATRRSRDFVVRARTPRDVGATIRNSPGAPLQNRSHRARNVLAVAVGLVVSMLTVVASGSPAGAVPSPASSSARSTAAAATPARRSTPISSSCSTAAPRRPSLDGLSVQYASATGTGNFGASRPARGAPRRRRPAGRTLPRRHDAAAPRGRLARARRTGTIAMGGTAGKVALATGATSLGCNGSSTLCSAAQLARIVDLVGYGDANFFEGRRHRRCPPPPPPSARRAASTPTTTSPTSPPSRRRPATRPARPAPCGGPPVNTPRRPSRPTRSPSSTRRHHRQLPASSSPTTSPWPTCSSGPLPDGITVDTGTPGPRAPSRSPSPTPCRAAPPTWR